MKTLLFLFSFFLTYLLFSQGNLQFNNVYTYSGVVNLTPGFTSACSGNVSYSYVSPTFTVPAGKIWKIERLYCTSPFFFVNGCRSGELVGFNGYTYDVPIWLKGGETLVFATNTLTHQYSINIVEFNNIP